MVNRCLCDYVLNKFTGRPYRVLLPTLPIFPTLPVMRAYTLPISPTLPRIPILLLVPTLPAMPTLIFNNPYTAAGAPYYIYYKIVYNSDIITMIKYNKKLHIEAPRRFISVSCLADHILEVHLDHSCLTNVVVPRLHMNMCLKYLVQPFPFLVSLNCVLVFLCYARL